MTIPNKTRVDPKDLDQKKLIDFYKINFPKNLQKETILKDSH